MHSSRDKFLDSEQTPIRSYKYMQNSDFPDLDFDDGSLGKASVRYLDPTNFEAQQSVIE